MTIEEGRRSDECHYRLEQAVIIRIVLVSRLGRVC